MELKPEVQLAIDYAAKDVAKAYCDMYGRGGDYASIKRAIAGFISMAVVKSELSKGACWFASGSQEPWTVKAQDPAAGMDQEALNRAVNKWWDSMDPAGQMRAIEHAGHHKSEFIRNIIQKYQGKPETQLMTEIPELAEVYRQELGAPMAEAPKQ